MNKEYLHVETRENDKFMEQIPHNLRGTFLLWKLGYYPKDWMSNTTFYNHRTELRKFGVNIAGLCPENERIV